MIYWMNETRTKTPAGEGFADMIFMTGNTYPKQGTLGHKEKTQDPSGRKKKKKEAGKRVWVNKGKGTDRQGGIWCGGLLLVESRLHWSFIVCGSQGPGWFPWSLQNTALTDLQGMACGCKTACHEDNNRYKNDLKSSKRALCTPVR